MAVGFNSQLEPEAIGFVAFLYDVRTATTMTSIMTFFALAAIASYANTVCTAEKLSLKMFE